MASFAIVLTVLAVVSALRSSVMAAPLVLAASGCGLVIAVVDALHDVTRSRVVAIAFAVAAVASGFSAVQSDGRAAVGASGAARRRGADRPRDATAAADAVSLEDPTRDDAVASADGR